MIKDLLVISGILIFLIEIYRILRRYWLRRLLEKKKKEKRSRKPAVLRLKSERDGRFYRENQSKRTGSKRETPISWQLRKGRGGRKKVVQTEGYFCPNKSCEYYGISKEEIHALVGYGSHGIHEVIQDFKCQACGKKFTARRNTILYRLKSHSALMEKILWLLAFGGDASALEEVFGVREITIRTWLCRSGMQGKKLHERFLAELELVHVQLDELWAKVKDGNAGFLRSVKGKRCGMVTRLRCDQVLFGPPPPREPKKRGRNKLHGQRFAFKEPDTWGQPDEGIELEDPYWGQVRLERWNNLHEKKGADVPYDVIRARVHREREKPPAALWLAWLTPKAIPAGLAVTCPSMYRCIAQSSGCSNGDYRARSHSGCSLIG